MLAVCNTDYEFNLIEIVEAGRQSNGGVFPNSNLGYAIVNDLLDFSEPENVNDSDFKLPFVFVGDDAFPMKTNLVKPYLICIWKNLSLITECPEQREL